MTTANSSVSAKITAIDAQLANTDLSAQALASLRKYKSALENPTRDYSKFVLPASIGGALLLSGVLFGALFTASAPETTTSKTSPGQTTSENLQPQPVQSTQSRLQTTLAARLDLYRVAATGSQSTSESIKSHEMVSAELPTLSESQLTRAAEIVRTNYQMGATAQSNAGAAARRVFLMDGTAKFSYYTANFLAEAILIDEGLATPTDF